MFLHTTTFPDRAAFLHRNVCDFPGDLTAEKLNVPDGEALLMGLVSLRELLLAIYDDPGTYLGADALESYHKLTYTVSLLQTAGAWGEPFKEGEEVFLSLDKGLIRKHFKKPAGPSLAALEHYGFHFDYSKKGKAASSYEACDTVRMRYEGPAGFFPALRLLVGRLPAVDNNKDYALQSDLFSKADYGAVFLNTPLGRRDVSPLRADILKTAGTNAALWTELVNTLTGKFGLKTGCKFWSYCTPQWVVHFIRKSKTVCIFSMTADILCFEMALSYEQAAELAGLGNALDPTLRKGMERLGCIGCGRCDGGDIVKVAGISLCPRQPDARRLAFNVDSLAEIGAVASLIVPAAAPVA